MSGLPDARDGLTKTQRRILLATARFDRPGFSNKAQAIIEHAADAFGRKPENYLPKLIWLASWWRIRYPLIQNLGNIGSIAGLPPADARFFEARIADAGQPHILSLKEWLSHYLASRTEAVRKKSASRLTRHAHRLNVLDGLLMAMESSGSVVALASWLSADDADEKLANIRISKARAKRILGKRFDRRLQEQHESNTIGLTSSQVSAICSLPAAEVYQLNRSILLSERRYLIAQSRSLQQTIDDHQSTIHAIHEELYGLHELNDQPRTEVLDF